MEIRRVIPKPYEKTISPAISFEVDIAHTEFQEAIISVEGLLESDHGKILADLVEIAPQKKSSEVGARDSKFDPKFTETDY